MAQLNGFIKLHRKLVQWGWYSDSCVKDLFIHLLLMANWKDTTYLGYDVKRGQAIVGFKKLSEDLGFTTQQIRTAMKKLESTGEISRFSTNKFSIVTIENYEDYQCDVLENNIPITNEQQTDNKQITNEQQTDNNTLRIKELKKERKDTITSEALQQVADAYNEKCPSLPQCKKLSNQRATAIRKRFKDGYKLEDFEKVFEAAEANDFLAGRVKNWKANFDWLINETNMIKVLEGNYKNDEYKNPFKD